MMMITRQITRDGLIAICKNGKWGFVNTSGEVIIKPTYDEARSFSNGVAAVKKDDKWGFINKDNKLVIDFQFTDVGYMGLNGLCPVRTDRLEDEIESSENNEEPNAALATWKFLELVIGIKEE